MTIRVSNESSLPFSAGVENHFQLPSATAASENLPHRLENATLQAAGAQPDELQKTFQDFVGQTFFGQMIASMRATQEDAPYFNGGRAEKIFQGQLDQVLAEELSDSSAAQFSDPMFKLFQLRRQ